MDRGGSSKEQDWLRVSQACAWYAEIAINRGEFDEAHLALSRAAALSEGRDASRWFLSGTKQLSYWNDGDYPTIQEYIVALMDRLNALEGK